MGFKMLDRKCESCMSQDRVALASKVGRTWQLRPRGCLLEQALTGILCGISTTKVHQVAMMSARAILKVMNTCHMKPHLPRKYARKKSEDWVRVSLNK